MPVNSTGNSCSITGLIYTTIKCYFLRVEHVIFSTGTLLRKLENGLRGISHVIVDEIHERDINVSFFYTGYYVESLLLINLDAVTDGVFLVLKRL